MNGYTNCTLRISLTNQKVVIEKTPNIYQQLMGGVGFGSYFLNKEVSPRIDPLSEGNKIIISTGPLQGSIIPIQGRYCITTKSPLTGLFLNSQVGGNIGPELKFAGYDNVIIEGRSSEPVFLSITGKTVNILKASFLKKKSTYQKEIMIKEKLDDPKAKIMTIGVAGENKVPIACVISEQHRAAGRGGLGAVFGSKNLYAISISADEHEEFTGADPERVETLSEDLKQRARKMKKVDGWINKYGTPYLVSIASTKDQLPIKNFSEGTLEEPTILNGEDFLERFNTRKKPCYKCVISCSSVYDEDFAFADKNQKISVPEYESIAMLGSNCGIFDTIPLIKANALANNLGLDTISLGNIIGFYMECSEKRALPKKFIRERVTFANVEGFFELIDKIAYKIGVGTVLGKGTRYLAKMFGNETNKYAINVKGLEMAAWDPRGKLGLGISYATAAEGASHLRGWPSTNKPPIEPITKEIIESLIEQQNLKIIKDSLIICHFVHSIEPAVDLTDSQNLYTAITGYTTDINIIAHNIWQLKRYFNVKEMSKAPRTYDQLPPRLMNEPLPSGTAKGAKAALNNDDFNNGLNMFYQLRGLTEQGDLSDQDRSHLEEILKIA